MAHLASYLLSAYSFISSHPLEKLLDVGYSSKDGDPIPSFDEGFLIDLCTEAQQVFEAESNILEIEGDFIIVGDIHGSLHDLLRILQHISQNNSKVLFLGDYVDRGSFSLECISILFALKIISPSSIYLIRGNHEFEEVCSKYGFKDEIINYHDPKKSTGQNTSRKNASSKDTKDQNENQNDEYYGYDMNCYQYSEKLYDAFMEAFSFLPIAAIINGTTFCVHGGLSPKLEHVDHIETFIQRPIKTFEENLLLSDLVWGDPSHSTKLFEENFRGRGYIFNRESITNFLSKSSLTRIVRGHQCVKNGCQKSFCDKCITVFSASSYDKSMGNSSSILQLFQNDDIISLKTFQPIPRLQKSDASYYKVQPLTPTNTRIKPCFSFLHPQLRLTGSLRMSASGSIMQLKTQRTDYCIAHQSPNSKFANIMKPNIKFTTNKKKTMSYIQRPKLANSASQSIFENGETKQMSLNRKNSEQLGITKYESI